MHRTTRRRTDPASLRASVLLVLATIVIVVLAVAATTTASSGAVHAGSDEAPPPPVTIAPEFLPESANLSDCVGLVERPGCGSKARGGWHQTAVFATLAVGLGVVFWRVSLGVRRNRATADASSSSIGASRAAETDPTPGGRST